MLQESKMKEKQVIVNWHTPDEPIKPTPGDITIATISGKRKDMRMDYDHTFALVEWWPEDGWVLVDIEQEEMESFAVHAWCDILPYGMREVTK